jgi:hypothetical protein
VRPDPSVDEVERTRIESPPSWSYGEYERRAAPVDVSGPPTTVYTGLSASAFQDAVVHDVDVPVRDTRWTAPAGRPPDGSDDWTVPMSVVPPEPEPEPERRRRARHEPDVGRGSAWADDTWAGDARYGVDRNGDRHRGAPAHGAHSAAVDLPPARVPPPARRAPAHLADERPRDRTPPGRHHRPDR